MTSARSAGEEDPTPFSASLEDSSREAGREPGREIEGLLKAWSQGDPLAEAQLFCAVYPQLQRIAARGLARAPSSVGLEPTDLVHDTYLRLVAQRTSWRSRDHFFATVATLVRRIVGDHAKHRLRQKRGGGAVHTSLDDLELVDPTSDFETRVLRQSVHRALWELHDIDRNAARVVVLRIFEGLSLDEVAVRLKVGRATVVRWWSVARSFLRHRLRSLHS